MIAAAWSDEDKAQLAEPDLLALFDRIVLKGSDIDTS